MATFSYQKSKKYLEKLGYTCGKVEQPFNPYSKKRNDLFGIFDLIAMQPSEGIVGVQCCGFDFAEHDRKILSSEHAITWLKSGGGLLLIGWRKILKKRGGKLKVYAPRIKTYKLEDFKINTMELT